MFIATRQERVAVLDSISFMASSSFPFWQLSTHLWPDCFSLLSWFTLIRLNIPYSTTERHYKPLPVAMLSPFTPRFVFHWPCLQIETLYLLPKLQACKLQSYQERNNLCPVVPALGSLADYQSCMLPGISSNIPIIGNGTSCSFLNRHSPLPQ